MRVEKNEDEKRWTVNAVDMIGCKKGNPSVREGDHLVLTNRPCTTGCSVLQCTTGYYNVPQGTTMYYKVLQCTTMYYSELIRTKMYYNVLEFNTM